MSASLIFLYSCRYQISDHNTLPAFHLLGLADSSVLMLNCYTPIRVIRSFVWNLIKTSLPRTFLLVVFLLDLSSFLYFLSCYCWLYQHTQHTISSLSVNHNLYADDIPSSSGNFDSISIAIICTSRPLCNRFPPGFPQIFLLLTLLF